MSHVTCLLTEPAHWHGRRSEGGAGSRSAGKTTGATPRLARSQRQLLPTAAMTIVAANIDGLVGDETHVTPVSQALLVMTTMCPGAAPGSVSHPPQPVPTLRA